MAFINRSRSSSLFGFMCFLEVLICFCLLLCPLELGLRFSFLCYLLHGCGGYAPSQQYKMLTIHQLTNQNTDANYQSPLLIAFCRLSCCWNLHAMQPYGISSSNSSRSTEEPMAILGVMTFSQLRTREKLTTCKIPKKPSAIYI